jgi:hypothetical protein
MLSGQADHRPPLLEVPPLLKLGGLGQVSIGIPYLFPSISGAKISSISQSVPTCFVLQISSEPNLMT